MMVDLKVVLLALVFAVLLGFTQMSTAFAATITISDQPSCEAIPGAIFNPAGNCLLTQDFTVSAGDTLIVENFQLASIVQGIDFTNFGTVELNGGSTGQSGVLNWGQGNLINECGAEINVNGNTGTQSGMLFAAFGVTMTNKGTINLFGNDGRQSGSFGSNNNLIQINNHGNVNENPGTGFESGVVWGVASFNDNLPPLCFAVCGPNTVLNSFGRCIPDFASICGEGTHQENLQCVITKVTRLGWDAIRNFLGFN